METVTCCQRNGYGEHGCREGKDCPAGRVDLSTILTRRVSAEDMTRRTQEAEYLWTRELGVEAADAPRVTGSVPPIVTTDLRPAREPFSGQAKVLIAAVILTWLAVGLLSIP